MIDPVELKTYIIKPALEQIGMDSPAAVQLLLGTAAQESRLGTHLIQFGGGPALGLYQMEPGTHSDLWENYLKYKPELSARVKTCTAIATPLELIYNLHYATVMARLQYWRFPDPLPEAGDVEGMARLWKKRYNTHLGKGTPEEFIENYNALIGGRGDR